MPEAPFSKVTPHPIRVGPVAGGVAGRGTEGGAGREAGPDYAELAVTSNYTFLTGASHPEELVSRAAALGHRAAAIADTHTLAGVVRAHVAAKTAGLPLAVGSHLRCGHEGPATGAETSGVTDVLVFASDRASYAGLCRLLTLGKRRAPKGACHLSIHDLLEHRAGLLAVVMPPEVIDERAVEVVEGLARAFDDDRLSLGVWRDFGPDDASRLAMVRELGTRTGVPLLACNRVLYHDPARRTLQDVLACIRLGCTLEEAGLRLSPHGERHLKGGSEMSRLLASCPGAVARAAEVAARAGAFSLDELRYAYPVESVPEGLTPMAYLRREVEAGAVRRYGPGGASVSVRGQLEHELGLIEELGYEAYFLTCHDLVKFARSRGILCQGRGGAANSAVCYCLGITEVDPGRFDLLFERFVSRSRGEPPDIDIDFEHERREEVIQYLYRRYGRERAALTAEVITYRGRSAVRDAGKALGFSADTLDVLAKNLDRWHEAPSADRARECGLDAGAPAVARLLAVADELTGFPRHLSQHVGGFVITRGPLCEMVPVENAAMEDRTVIEWDKDDLDAMGMLKVDVLGLGMLTCVRKAMGLVFGAAAPPSVSALVGGADETGVYDMICRADTVGVFQIESRAQMQMLPRLRPRTFYDLVIEVAIVRPGPIQGKMVHPYLRRRSGEEAVTYPDAQVERVLGRTLGVPLFQEQAMRLAIVAAGFTPDEADALRRAMAAWKRKGDAIVRFGAKIVEGMIGRGYAPEFAHRCFEQIKGFSEYGFPESHAASFALLVYASAWLKHHHPGAFAAALINSQPMGFYAPAQIVRDAREHGVEVRPVDVNASDWDCTLEPGGPGGPALRLGMRLVKGLGRDEAEAITRAVRAHGPMTSLAMLRRCSGASVGALRALARAEAMTSMGLDRRAALWQTRALRDQAMPLFDRTAREAGGAGAGDGWDQGGDEGGGDDAAWSGDDAGLADDAAWISERLTGLERAALGAMRPQEGLDRVLHDYEATGLSLRSHPMAFARGALAARGVIEAAQLRDARACPQGMLVSVAGVVLVRQKPGTAHGVVFITLEDETGVANLVLWRETFERARAAARLGRVLLVSGRVARQGEVVHVHARAVRSLDACFPALASASRDFH